MTTAQQVIAAARSFMGVRFAHQGRSAEGVDCLGLLLLTAEKAKLKFGEVTSLGLDVPYYGTRPDTELLSQKLGLHLVPVKRPKPADIVVLEIEGRPQHLAMLTDYPHGDGLGMIHAYAATRRVVEHQYDAEWQQATRAIFRLPQLIRHC